MNSPDIVWYPVLLLLFLAGGLGVRALGVWAAARHLREPTPERWFSVFILLFLAAGYCLSELLFIGRPGGQNNAVWFYVQSLMASWFVVFTWLAQAERQTRMAHVLVPLVVILAAPTTVQFLSQRSASELRFVGPEDRAVIDFLGSTDPQSVVLHPLNLDGPSLASNFAGRSAVFSPFLSFTTEADGLSERAADIARFYAADASTDQRLRVLRRYGVDYVLVPTGGTSGISSVPGMRLELSTPSINVLCFIDPG